MENDEESLVSLVNRRRALEEGFLAGAISSGPSPPQPHSSPYLLASPPLLTALTNTSNAYLSLIHDVVLFSALKIPSSLSDTFLAGSPSSGWAR